MKIARFSRLFAAVALLLTSILAINMPQAQAATATWTGAANDGQWSTAGNWSSGVPNNGDDLVFDNSSYGTTQIVQNIPNLTVNSITFINNGTTPINIELDENLAVSSHIAQSSSVTSSINTISSASGSRTITLAGDVTIRSAAGLNLGSTGSSDVIALAGHTLIFTNATSYSTNSVLNIYSNIIGNGSVRYNSATTDFRVYGVNTYSGSTRILASRTTLGNVSNNNAFGTSSITIDTGNTVTYRRASNATITNSITVNGTKKPVTSLIFNNTGTSKVTLRFTNINLNSNTRFLNSASPISKLSVNLAGIDANGHCVEYLGGASASNHSAAISGFINGPAACTSDATVGAPDTGFGIATANPITLLAVTGLASMSLILIARRVVQKQK